MDAGVEHLNFHIYLHIMCYKTTVHSFHAQIYGWFRSGRR